MSFPFVVMTVEFLAMPTMAQHNAWQNTPTSHSAQIPVMVIECMGQHFPKVPPALPDTSLQDAVGRKRALSRHEYGQYMIN